MSIALSLGKGRGSGPVLNTSLPPTVTQNTPLRGRSAPALIDTGMPSRLLAKREARVLKAPQLLHASTATPPPPPPPDFFGDFLAIVFFGGAAFLAFALAFFGGIAACQLVAAGQHSHPLSLRGRKCHVGPIMK
eukprot:COSAG01_NODE_5922_length_3950_cov_3.461958_7_plen_134_part_00